MLLAHRGYKVTLLEKNDRVGGRNARLDLGDYSFDTGPTFLHQKFTLDEVFAEVGRKSEDYLDFVKLDPMTRLTWGGVSLETSFQREKMAANIAEVFPGEEENFEIHGRSCRKTPHDLPAYKKALLKAGCLHRPRPVESFTIRSNQQIGHGSAR